MTYDPSFNPALGEGSPPIGPESRQGPGLYLIQGGGEDVSDLSDPGRPDLYVVPNVVLDPDDALTAETAVTEGLTDDGLTSEGLSTVTPTAEVDEADALRSPIRRQRAAGEAGRRMVHNTSPAKIGEHVVSEVAEIYWGERRRKGGGGSWLIREHMRKLEAEAKARAEAEAESHESNCDCPLHDKLAA